MNPDRAPLTPHARRRRAIQQRQTTIIGGLVAVLLLVALVAAAIYAQILPAPFERDFSSDPESASGGTVPAADSPPCPPADAQPRPFDEITANVFNATDRAGLAGTTSQELVAAGVVVNQQGNWGGGTYEGAVRVVAGANGVVPAYSIARMFPSAEVAMDDRTDESVDLILGAAFDAPLTPEEIAALDPAAPLVAPEGCVPVEEVPSDG